MTRILSLLIILLTATAAVDPERYFALMGEADEAIAQEEWTEAENKLLEAMRLEPANPLNVLLLSNLGMVRFYSGRDSLALATLNDAHNMVPTSVTVLKNRAKVLAATGHEREAYDDYTTILELDSAAVEPRMRHGMIAMRLGDLTTAEADFNELMRQAPESREANLGMASWLTANGRHKEAIPHFTQLIKLEPSADYYASRAACYLMEEDLMAASDDIAAGLQLDPADGELYLYRAVLNKMRFRPDDAKADARRAIELGENPARVHALTD